MGCHTWFYKKVNRSIEEAREKCIQTKRRHLDLNKAIIADKNHGGIDWNEYDEDTNSNDNDRRFNVEVLERQIKLIEAGKCDRAVFNQQPELSMYIDGKGFFVDNKDYHDLFRKGGYPDDILWSLEETLEYIKEHSCSMYDWTEEKLKEFWSECPDGFIKFG